MYGPWINTRNEPHAEPGVSPWTGKHLYSLSWHKNTCKTITMDYWADSQDCSFPDGSPAFILLVNEQLGNDEWSCQPATTLGEQHYSASLLEAASDMKPKGWTKLSSGISLQPKFSHHDDSHLWALLFPSVSPMWFLLWFGPLTIHTVLPVETWASPSGPTLSSSLVPSHTNPEDQPRSPGERWA